MLRVETVLDIAAGDFLIADMPTIPQAQVSNYMSWMRGSFSSARSASSMNSSSTCFRPRSMGFALLKRLHLLYQIAVGFCDLTVLVMSEDALTL